MAISKDRIFSCPYIHFLLQAANAKYAKPTTQVGPSQMVNFEENEIRLDIEVEGVVLENGWAITPFTYPGVRLCTITSCYDPQ